jgi:hypothetical protein
MSGGINSLSQYYAGVRRTLPVSVRTQLSRNFLRGSLAFLSAFPSATQRPAASQTPSEWSEVSSDAG